MGQESFASRTSKLFTLYNGWGDVAKTLAFYNAQRVGVTVDRNDSDALLNWNAYSMNQFDSQHQDMIAKIKDDGISVEAAAAAAQRLISTGSSGDPRIGTNRAIGAVPIYTKLGGPIAGLTAGNNSIGGGAATAQTAFTKVYVTGDSLTVGMKTDLTALLGSALVPPIEAEVGRKIEQAVPLVNFPADTDTVLVGLGTNNFSDSPDVFRTKVQSMVSAIRAINPNATIHWINIYAPREDIASKVDSLNIILNELAATDTKFKVIDWKKEAINGQYRFTDQLHITAADYKRRAEFVYRALSGGGASQAVPLDECAGQTAGGPGAVQGNIVQTALNFSWYEPEKVEQIRAVRNNGPCSMRGNPGECGRLSRQAGALIGEGDAKPAYVAAVREFNKGNDSDGANWAFSDCGVFVATVIRASGADPDFAKRGTSIQREYMESSGKYDLIPFTDTALAQPGDILIKDGHIRIFLGDNPTSQFNVAEASWGNHVPATLWNATIDASNPNDAAGATYSIARLRK